MKRFFIGITILGAAFFLLVIIARLTNALQFYRAASASMSPGIEVNDFVFSTNLAKPKHNDIIVFNRVTDIYDGVEPGTTSKWIFRMIATGGEKLEIKNGLAYVNDRLADDSTKLKFYYTFDARKTIAVLSDLHLDKTKLPENDWSIYDTTTTIALLTYPQYIIAQKITPLSKWHDLPETSLYKNNSNKNWTISNYGPIFIPVGYYFLMGDNRNGARDSRFIGPVNEKDVTGVIIGRK